MNIEKLEQLLLLEINANRLDNGSCGLTSIVSSTDSWYESRKKRTEKLSPIEKIMDIILVSVEDMLDEVFVFDKHPHILWQPQKQIGKYRADFEVSLFGFPRKRYIIECDGHDFHEKTKEQAKYDKQRERFFVSKRYKVLRFSGSEIIGDFSKIKIELFDIFKNEIEECAND